MTMRVPLAATVVVLIATPLLGQALQSPRPVSPDLALQVRLDRAGFSPGEIDGVPGANTKNAVAAYTAARGSLDALQSDSMPVTTVYAIADGDVAGPFVESIPEDMMAKAALPRLSYTSPLEALAERFHAAPALLRRLNPNALFVAGEQITVPNIAEPRLVRGTAADVMVSRSSSTLTIRDGAGATIFFAPVTSGSEHDPLPFGDWRITGVSRDPWFHYNPSLFWDADPSHAKAKVPPGPNSPVGVVWIDIDKPHYGLHGTPEPGQIGHTQSHGCVRMTNWDALTVAGLVTPGTPVYFRP